MHVSLNDDALTGVGQGETEGVIAGGAAVDEEPAALRPIGLGRQTLGELKRRPLGIAPDIDPFDPGRDVEPQRLLAEGFDEPRIGARAALVARDVKATRIAIRVRDQGVQVRSL